MECTENDKKIITHDLSIIRKGPYNYIEKDNNLIKKRLTAFNVNISTMNYVHSKILTNEWDFIDSLKHWTQIDETSGRYRIDKKFDDDKIIENNINLKGIKQELIKVYESVSENIKFYIRIIFIAISVIIIIAIIYFIKINNLLKWCYNKKKIQNERLDKINNNNKEINVCEQGILLSSMHSRHLLTSLDRRRKF